MKNSTNQQKIENVRLCFQIKVKNVESNVVCFGFVVGFNELIRNEKIRNGILRIQIQNFDVLPNFDA